MKSIRTAFTCAAEGGTSPTGFGVFWVMVAFIAIIDDEERREEKRRRKRNACPFCPKP